MDIIILFILSIALFLFFITIGVGLAWKVGWKWGIWEAEKKWKADRGIK